MDLFEQIQCHRIRIRIRIRDGGTSGAYFILFYSTTTCTYITLTYKLLLLLFHHDFSVIRLFIQSERL
jgi:hypothetical protein